MSLFFYQRKSKYCNLVERGRRFRAEVCIREVILDRGNFEIVRVGNIWKKNSGHSSSESDLISCIRLSVVWSFPVKFLRRRPIVAGGIIALPEYVGMLSCEGKVSICLLSTSNHKSTFSSLV